MTRFSARWFARNVRGVAIRTAQNVKMAALSVSGTARLAAAQHRPLFLDRRQFESGLRRQEARITALPGTAEASSEVEIDRKISPLAWLCVRRGREYRFTIGRGVERFPDGFFEGGWIGDFGAFDQIAGTEHFGSGALFDGPDPLFMPPKNPLEFIFVLRDKESRRDLISNSLCFCFAAGAVSRQEGIFRAADASLVRTTHSATARGVHRYDPVVAETDKHVLLRLMHNNFRFTADGHIRFEQPFTGREFRDYSEYREYLSATVSTAFANVMDRRRAMRLSPIAAISGGYDSTAVAVLAREHGCDEAVTIDVTVNGVDDSGARVAERLGMKVRAFEHVAGTRDLASLGWHFDRKMRERAEEFLATAGIGDDVTFAAFEPALAGRTLLTGAYGDACWERTVPRRPGLPVRIRFGKSMTEFRLRVGF